MDGSVARFRFGLMPNATLYHLASMVAADIRGFRTERLLLDAYVHCDLDYLQLLQRSDDAVTLLALVGVQSHQFQRALDLASFVRSRGVEHCVACGTHPMTC